MGFFWEILMKKVSNEIKENKKNALLQKYCIVNPVTRKIDIMCNSLYKAHPTARELTDLRPEVFIKKSISKFIIHK